MWLGEISAVSVHEGGSLEPTSPQDEMLYGCAVPGHDALSEECGSQGFQDKDEVSLLLGDSQAGGGIELERQG